MSRSADGMLARAQRWVIVAWAVLALGWLGWYAWRGDLGHAVVGFLLIVGAHALVLGVEFLLLPWINRDDPAPPAHSMQLCRAWWR